MRKLLFQGYSYDSHLSRGYSAPALLLAYRFRTTYGEAFVVP